MTCFVCCISGAWASRAISVKVRKTQITLLTDSIKYLLAEPMCLWIVVRSCSYRWFPDPSTPTIQRSPLLLCAYFHFISLGCDKFSSYWSICVSLNHWNVCLMFYLTHILYYLRIIQIQCVPLWFSFYNIITFNCTVLFFLFII